MNRVALIVSRLAVESLFSDVYPSHYITSISNSVIPNIRPIGIRGVESPPNVVFPRFVLTGIEANKVCPIVTRFTDLETDSNVVVTGVDGTVSTNF